jgi:RNA polymerase sigma factor for flagellar operon FliA
MSAAEQGGASSLDARVLPNPVEQRRMREAMPIVAEVARRLAGQFGDAIGLDELQSIGRAALVELVRRYDPEGAPFAAYLRLHLRWAMLDGVRRERRSHRAVARALGLAGCDQLAQATGAKVLGAAPPSERQQLTRLRQWLDERAAALGVALLAAGPPPEDPEKITQRRAAVRRLDAAIAELDDTDERQLVRRHYFDDEALEQVASELGKSKSWASRRHARAIRSLARKLRGSDADPSA